MAASFFPHKSQHRSCHSLALQPPAISQNSAANDTAAYTTMLLQNFTRSTDCPRWARRLNLCQEGQALQKPMFEIHLGPRKLMLGHILWTSWAMKLVLGTPLGAPWPHYRPSRQAFHQSSFATTSYPLSIWFVTHHLGVANITSVLQLPYDLRCPAK